MRRFCSKTSRFSESERQLAGAQRIAHLGSWQWDLSDGSMRWSDELFRICGFEPAAVPASHQAFLESIHPQDREYFRKSLQEAVDNRLPFGVHFCRIVRPDGSI